MTHTGYVKRLPVAEYKTHHRGAMGVTAHKTKNEDFVEQMFVTCTHDDLLLFTDKGKVYTIKAYEVPEADRTARGRAVVNLIQIEQGEKVNAIIPIAEDTGYDGYLLLATKNGLIKKTVFTEFESIRKGGKIAISLVGDDEVIGVAHIHDGDEILVASSAGKCIRFAESDVRAMGRDTMGVKSIDLDDGERVIDMAVITKDCEQEILTVSEYGFGKRSGLDDYRCQVRGGKGVKAGNFNAQTGGLVNLKLINPEDDVMLIADNGIIMRVHACEISKIGRDTKGVKIMTLKNEGKIVSVSVTVREDEEEPADGEEVATELSDAPETADGETTVSEETTEE
jgi:DNA gyrase subunit A